MKKFFIISTLLAISCIYAQKRIAITTFEGSGVDAITAKNITDRFSHEISRTKRFDIVEREMIKKILEEQKFQKSGCVADECAVEIGQMIGVEQIIAGSVSKIENFYSLSIRLISVETGEIIYQDIADYEGSIKDFIQVTIKNLALRMAAEVSIGSVQTGETAQYALTKKGEVSFNINQSNVSIFVDGRYSSRSLGNQVILSIAEGSHTVKFSLSGYKDWEKEFNVLADEQITYDVKLMPGSSTKVEATTGILLVRSDPDGSTVFVDGIEKGTTLFQNADIGAGEHEIRVQKNMYHPYTEILNIQPDMISEIEAILKPNFGKLSINSLPTDAVVMINGQIKGKTPYSIDKIESGSYNIQISKDLYHKHEENFIITDGSINQREILLTPAFGKLIVKTRPTSAEVRLDGQGRGFTPFELDELPSGNYHLTLLKDLFQTIEQDIVIEDGQTHTLFFKLEARSGLLSITGQPSGAEIIANNKKIGNIPLKNYRIAEGMFELTVNAKKYHSKTEFMNIQRDKVYNQVFNLDPHTGKLIIITEPPDANFLLDKEAKGKTPIILDDVPIGLHTIEVKHPNFLTQSKKFTLNLNDKKEFRFKLVTYAGSIQQQIDKTKFKQRISFGGSAVLLLFGLAMNASAQSDYDAYLSTSSAADATDYYDKSVLKDKIAAGSYILASAMGLTGVKFTLDIGKLKKQLKGK